MLLTIFFTAFLPPTSLAFNVRSDFSGSDLFFGLGFEKSRTWSGRRRREPFIHGAVGIFMGAWDGEIGSGEVVIFVGLEVEEVINEAGFALLFTVLLFEDSKEEEMGE